MGALDLEVEPADSGWLVAEPTDSGWLAAEPADSGWLVAGIFRPQR